MTVYINLCPLYLSSERHLWKTDSYPTTGGSLWQVAQCIRKFVVKYLTTVYVLHKFVGCTPAIKRIGTVE